MHQPNSAGARRVVPLAVVGSLAVSLGLAAPAEASTPQPRADKTKSPALGSPSNRAVKPRLEATPASYTVVPGDTVSGIAERFGLQIDSLLALNGLDWSTLIFPGQELALGGSARAAGASSTEGADASGSPSTHTVVAGDTLWDLSETSGVSVQTIADANGIARDTALQIGQSLVIPTGAATSSVAATSSATPMTVSAAESGGSESPEASLGAVPLNEEMRENALLIIATARELGVRDYGIIVALAAAAQESGLINVNHGDRDSLGLFQQRPSAGWGSAVQVVDPAWSIPAFFRGVDGPQGSTVGLLDIEAWESMSVAQAAQAVQISGFPNHYAKWEDAARGWLAELG